jgi:uncharacterized pyridoxamine 5'-phosphate oxidase family protein
MLTYADKRKAEEEAAAVRAKKRAEEEEELRLKNMQWVREPSLRYIYTSSTLRPHTLVA